MLGASVRCPPGVSADTLADTPARRSAHAHSVTMVAVLVAAVVMAVVMPSVAVVTIVVARCRTIDHDIAVPMPRRCVVVARATIVAAVVAVIVTIVVAAVAMAMVTVVGNRDAERGARDRPDDGSLIAADGMPDHASDAGSDQAAGGLVTGQAWHRNAGEQRPGDEENLPVHVNFSVSSLDRGRFEAALPVCKYCGANMEFHSCGERSELSS